MYLRSIFYFSDRLRVCRLAAGFIMQNYKGLTVLVTGASSGIGKSFATALAAKGAHLVITARSAGALQGLADQLRSKYGVNVMVVPLDLGVAGQAQVLYKAIKNAGIQVDVVVNNAGFGKWGGFTDIDVAAYQQMLSLNVNSLMELCYLFLPEMAARKSGGVINVGSTAALVPVPYAAVYAASKAFVLSLSESLYGEYAPLGVTVMALCPGGTASNFASVARPDNAPVGTTTAASPDDVAEVALTAFLQKRSYVVPGMGNYINAVVLPRLMTRQMLIGVIANMWRKIVGK